MEMKRVIVFGALAAVMLAAPALATMGSGVTGVFLADSTLEEKIKIKEHGPSDLVFQRVTIAPGGHTGWHTHPGAALAAVTAGTVTLYQGDDRKCRPQVYTAGQAFVDPGHGNVHIARNEGDVPVEIYVAYTGVPAGSPPSAVRIDVNPAPGNCEF
jgi:quercetin dioxygenase-like cupin family protein